MLDREASRLAHVQLLDQLAVEHHEGRARGRRLLEGRHHAARPLDDAGMARLERALAECTPTPADEAEVKGTPAGAPSRSEAARREAPACLMANPPRKRKRRK